MSEEPAKPGKDQPTDAQRFQAERPAEAKHIEELKKQAMGGAASQKNFEEMKKQVISRIEKMRSDPTEANRLIAAQLRAGLDSVSDKFDMADAIRNIPLVNNPLAPIQDQMKRIEEKLDAILKHLGIKAD
jgi:molecular chaperone GrpE (heat shock protein)